MSTVDTSGDIDSVCTGLAVKDVLYNFCLYDSRRTGLQVSGVKLLQDILHVWLVAHCPPPFRHFFKPVKGAAEPHERLGRHRQVHIRGA